MPAARPSQPAVANVVGALVSAGLRVAAVQVGADGSFSVQVADATQATSVTSEKFAATENVRDDEPPSWDDLDE
jgi:hypothetical protein